MIQTNALTTAFSGLNFDMEPKQINNPSGKANTSVNTNNRHDNPKPFNNSLVTDAKSTFFFLFLFKVGNAAAKNLCDCASPLYAFPNK